MEPKKFEETECAIHADVEELEEKIAPGAFPVYPFAGTWPWVR